MIIPFNLSCNINFVLLNEFRVIFFFAGFFLVYAEIEGIDLWGLGVLL